MQNILIRNILKLNVERGAKMDDISKGLKIIELVKEIMKITKKIARHQFDQFDITAPQGMLLGQLIRHGKMKVSDLSKKMGLSNSTVSGIIDRLEKQGMVQRIRSQEDRRVVYVDVTPKFKDAFEKNFKDMEKRFEEILNRADEKEIDTILNGLETLKKVLDRYVYK